MPRVLVSGTSSEQYHFKIRGAPAINASYEELVELFGHFPDGLGQDVEKEDSGTIDPQLILDGAPDTTYIWSAPDEVMSLINMAIVAKELDRRVVWY
jgi:hypothetical protein